MSEIMGWDDFMNLSGQSARAEAREHGARVIRPATPNGVSISISMLHDKLMKEYGGRKLQASDLAVAIIKIENRWSNWQDSVKRAIIANPGLLDGAGRYSRLIAKVILAKIANESAV